MARPVVLLADDEPCITHMVGSVLRGRGMEVITARNGADALALALEKRPHLIVTDYQMPKMDGLQLATRLRSEEATCETPVIIEQRAFALGRVIAAAIAP